MSVIKFAEEFARLIIRYTKTSSSNNDSLNLTDREIVFTIHHVLRALSIKDFDDKNNNLLQIPNNGNDDITPETLVDNGKLDIKNICSSQDVQSVTDEDSSSVSDISLKGIKKDRENQESSLTTMENEKKFISQSNPAICLNNISRSDTFVREENQKIITENQVDVCEYFKFHGETEDLSNDLFQIAVSEMRKSVMDLMAKLNYLEQSLPRLIVGLSKEDEKKVQHTFNGQFTKSLIDINNINNQSSPHRTSTVKTKVSTNTHRTSCVFPRTPTASKLFATENGNSSERRKSTGGIGTNTKVTPSKTGEFKFTKNPKYAHVRSTIPKPVSQKKNVH